MLGTRKACSSVTHLWERHKQIARLLLQGKTLVEVAKEMKYSPVWISVVSNSPVFKKYLESLRGRVELGITDIRTEINNGASKSVGLLIKLMDDPQTNSQTKAKIAHDFLDRAGFGAVKTIRSENLSVHLTGDRIAELKEKRENLLRQSQIEHRTIEAQLC